MASDSTLVDLKVNTPATDIGEREPDEPLADTLREQPQPCSCEDDCTGCAIKGKGIPAPAGRYCIAGWEGWRY